MQALKAATSILEKKAAISVHDNAVRPRTIKITKKIAEQIRTVPTEGWIHINPSDGKWKVRKHSLYRASGIYDNIETAISAAKKLNRASPHPYIFVHKDTGEIAETIHE